MPCMQKAVGWILCTTWTPGITGHIPGDPQHCISQAYGVSQGGISVLWSTAQNVKNIKIKILCPYVFVFILCNSEKVKEKKNLFFYIYHYSNIFISVFKSVLFTCQQILSYQ